MSTPDPVKRKFRSVMNLCGLFVLVMLGSLIWVCSRPQTEAIQAAEKRSILACRTQSTDMARTEIFRMERQKACAEMEKQYLRKFQERP